METTVYDTSVRKKLDLILHHDKHLAVQVDEAQAADDRDWDVDSVLTLVQKAARSWNPDRLQRFPDLRCVMYAVALVEPSIDKINLYACSWMLAGSIRCH